MTPSLYLMPMTEVPVTRGRLLSASVQGRLSSLSVRDRRRSRSVVRRRHTHRVRVHVELLVRGEGLAPGGGVLDDESEERLCGDEW